MTTASIRRLAHDSGDGATVLHCPFCGGGQVIGRSDGTIECQFDGTAFTVQVQPLYSGFPQSINGQPFPIPGMPGQIGGPPMAPGPMDAMMPPGAPPEDGANPFADDGAEGPDAGGDAPPWADDTDTPEGDTPPADDSGGDGPPPPKGKSKKKSSAALYTTATGARLSGRAYAEYLAVRHCADWERAAVLERLRASRGRW